MSITYTTEIPQNHASLIALYQNAGWTAYTAKPQQLLSAIHSSQSVLLAMDGDKVVGLIRTVGDGHTIVYIQDILVHSDYKRRGIGATLMRSTLEQFKGCRQKVLLTEDNAETRAFYEAMGFQSCDQGKLVSFVKLD